MFERVLKFNPNHDAIGRFASKDGPGLQSIAALETGKSLPTHEEVRQHVQNLIKKSIGQPAVNVFVADHPTAIKAGFEVARVLHEMQGKGYKMPASVFVELAYSKDPAGQTRFVTPPGEPQHAVLNIFIPETIPRDMDLDTAVKKAFGGTTTPGGPIDNFAVKNMRDIIIHEMGHVQAGIGHTHKEMIAAFGGDPSDPSGVLGRAPILTPSAQERAHTARLHVSNYADYSVHEFLAEAFVRLYRGEQLAPDSQFLYDALKGPKIL